MDPDLAKRIESLSPAKRRLMEMLIAQDGDRNRRESEQNILSPRPQSHASVVPLSSVQKEWWFLEQIAPGSRVANLQCQLRLDGALDIGALAYAFEQIVRRHEILRTRFTTVAGQPVQTIEAAAPVEMPLVDLTEHSDEYRGLAIEKCTRERATPALDISRPPLFRVALLRVRDDLHLLLLLVHHLVWDGWSMGVVLRELALHYGAYVSGWPARVPELPIQYADIAYHENTPPWRLAEMRELAYWRQRLSGAADLRLLSKRPARAHSTFPIAYEHVVFPGGLSSHVRDLAGNLGATLFATLLAALKLVLHRYTQQGDIVVSAPHANRDQPQTQDLIGCLAHYLVFRTALSPADTFRTLAARVRETILEAYAHQEVAFLRIVQAAQHTQEGQSFNPTQVVFNLLSGSQMYPAVETRDLKIRIDNDGALGSVGFGFELALLVYEWEDSLRAVMAYESGRFEPEYVRGILQSYVAVLDQAVRNPDFPIDQPVLKGTPAGPASRFHTIVIASTFEPEGLRNALAFWLDELDCPSDVKFVATSGISEEAQAWGSPWAPSHAGLNVVLLRPEDWLRSGITGFRQNVRNLIRAIKTIAPESAPFLICVCPPAGAAATEEVRWMEAILDSELSNLSNVSVRSSSALIATYPSGQYDSAPVLTSMLATVIARALYSLERPAYKVLVLDCDQTLWRGIAAEVGPGTIEVDPPYWAVQEFVVAQHDAGMLLCLCTRNEESVVWDVFARNPQMPLKREHLVSYRVNWRPKSENIASLADELGFALASFIFLDDDPAECAEVAANCPDVLCLLLPRVPEARANFLHNVWAFDRWNVTNEDRQRPVAYRQAEQRTRARAESPSMEDFLAGLRLNVDISPPGSSQIPRVAQLLQRVTQFVTVERRLTESEIRREIELHEVEYLVVEARDRFGDYGLIGAIAFKTEPGVVRIISLALSCRAFGRGIEHRMLARIGGLALAQGRAKVEVCYRPSTRNRPALDFLENMAASQRESGEGGIRFVFSSATLAAATYHPPGGGALRQMGEAKRPADTAPNPPGRISAELLTRIATDLSDAVHIEAAINHWYRGNRGARGEPPVRPRTDLEKTLARLWSQCLGVEEIGINENFFELGGHSMLAVQLMSRVAADFQVDLPLNTVFGATTIFELARIIESSPSRGRRPQHSALVPIVSGGSNPPFFLVHGIDGSVVGYYGLARHLGPDQPFYALRALGLDGNTGPCATRVEEMAGGYVNAIQSAHPHGPVFVGGWSFGAMVAYEVTRKLQQNGREVAFLALLDGLAPVRLSKRTVFDVSAAPLVKLFGGLMGLVGVDVDRLSEELAELRPEKRWQRVIERADEETVGFLVSILVGHQALPRSDIRVLYEYLAGLAPADRLRHVLEELIRVKALPASSAVAEVQSRLAVFKANLKAMLMYAPEGRLDNFPWRFFAANELLAQELRPQIADPLWGWGEFFTEPIGPEVVEGNHYSMLMEPPVADLAGRLMACFSESARSHAAHAASTGSPPVTS